MQASEVLTLMPVIVHFCKSVVEPAKVAPLTCKAFLAVATVLFLLSEGQQAGITTPANLQEAMALMLTTCFAAEWDLFPKFHWGLHMPFQLQRWGKLLSCFTCERKHKIVKKWGNPMHNTTNFESSVGKEILAEEIARLQQLDVFQEGPCLLNPHRATKQLVEFTHQWIGERCEVSTKGDMVLLAGDTLVAALAFAFVAVPGHVFFLLQYLDVQSYNLETGSAICSLCQTKDLIDVEHLEISVPFTEGNDNSFKILLPWQRLQKKKKLAFSGLKFLKLLQAVSHFLSRSMATSCCSKGCICLNFQHFQKKSNQIIVPSCLMFQLLFWH